MRTCFVGSFLGGLPSGIKTSSGLINPFDVDGLPGPLFLTEGGFIPCFFTRDFFLIWLDVSWLPQNSPTFTIYFCSISPEDPASCLETTLWSQLGDKCITETRLYRIIVRPSRRNQSPQLRKCSAPCPWPWKGPERARSRNNFYDD